MTYEMAQKYGQKTGIILNFKKGTPIYELKFQYCDYVGGGNNINMYQKTNKILPMDCTHELTEADKINRICRVGEDAETGQWGYMVRIKDATNYYSLYSKYIIIGLIVISLISFIIYKHKH